MTPEETLPSERPMPEGAVLALWVIYERPSDFPKGYVLRCQWAMKGGEIRPDTVAWYAATADELRAIVPFGLALLSRSASDDPCILETWV